MTEIFVIITKISDEYTYLIGEIVQHLPQHERTGKGRLKRTCLGLVETRKRSPNPLWGKRRLLLIG